MAERAAYDEAAKSGLYEKPTGIRGKYDNVRRFWEDEVLCSFLSPYLERLVAERNKLRILDLGCGSGDGYELLMAVGRRGVGFSQRDCKILTEELLHFYRGIDINQNLIEQANATYGNRSGVVFDVGDFSELASLLQKDQPYDVYLATYGTFSHNSAEQTVKLLSDIARHGRDGSVILCDWLGRYCYEWQTLWTNDLEQNKTIDYLISYLYSDEAEKARLSSFPLHLVCAPEALAMVREGSKAAGIEIELRQLFDRSILVGRHTDTRQYNCHCQPIRRTVNHLFEPNTRTDLTELLVSYIPRDGFSEQNQFYQGLSQCWNALVTYTMRLLESVDSGGKENLPLATEASPRVLRQAMLEMNKIVRAATELKVADPRASVVEPQLAYRLRQLEIELQQGRGCGHGLVAILELHK